MLGSNRDIRSGLRVLRKGVKSIGRRIKAIEKRSLACATNFKGFKSGAECGEHGAQLLGLWLQEKGVMEAARDCASSKSLSSSEDDAVVRKACVGVAVAALRRLSPHPHLAPRLQRLARHLALRSRLSRWHLHVSGLYFDRATCLTRRCRRRLHRRIASALGRGLALRRAALRQRLASVRRRLLSPRISSFAAVLLRKEARRLRRGLRKLQF